MTNVWCVRAGGGMYADNFLRGGFVGIGWREILLSNDVNEIHRFLIEIQPNDHVIIPSANTDLLIHGVVDEATPYYDPSGDDGCPLRHRRPVTWATEPIRLDLFSTLFRDSIRTLLTVPAHNRMRSLLTVFMVEHEAEFIRAIGPNDRVASAPPATWKESHRIVLEQLMQLTPPEFERLVVHLLDALGFEDWERADLISRHWSHLPGELRDRLSLEQALVRN
ncbi:hypothetical protein KBZ12_09690 [Cyanobium sp. Cruz CV13-4-11]|uniref:hypothetical protein n=2 Tax=unclassified Cyanobium TaxID=2627006 RepID=UPI0020CFE785|nr:hypothetical protein [Cyanobium sp. Cruz CV13-4-11]MCP9919750.1 hypothetical protein [Cyanobium sp. Cruz CV13-4-11]